MGQVLKEIFEGIVEGETPLVEQKVREALEAGLKPEVILNEGMIGAMAEVGQCFEDGTYFVPEMLISARALKQGLEILKPHLLRSDVKAAGKVLVGTVRGDLHDIGKNLVGMMLEGAGFEIVDLGTNVSPQQFVEAVRTRGGDILAMSALLTTTMLAMKETIAALETAGLRDKIKIIVGGAPLSRAFAEKIGADGYAEDASRAATLAKSLLS